MPRRTILILLLIGINVALICGGYTAIWWIFANDLKAEVISWIERRQAEGFEVAYEKVSIEGYPLEIVLVMTAPQLARAEKDGSWIWNSEEAVLSARPWRLQQPIILARGHQKLRIWENDTHRSIEISTRRASAQIHFGTFQQLEEIGIDIQGFKVQTVSGKDIVDVGRVRIDARRDFRAEMPPPLHIIVRTESIVIPNAVAGLGNRIDEMQFYSVVDDSTISLGPLTTTLTSWRDQGGIVEVKKFAVQWSELNVVADGTLALDEKMRPIGAGRAEISGYSDVIKGLVAERHINRRDGVAAETLLDAFAQLSPHDGRVSLPIRIQDGSFFLGPLRLVQLDPIVSSRFVP